MMNKQRIKHMLNKPNKMIMKKSLILAVASLAVIGCSKREMGVDPNAADPNEVRFSAGGATVTSKVTTDATTGKTVFEQNDLIGVYAVVDGKKLGTDGSNAFPASLQYLNKKFKVTSVKAATTTDPAVATFTANANGDKMYYLAGDQAWNYYAYYPTTGNAMFSSLPTAATNAAAGQFVKTDNTNTFYNQTALSTSSSLYPGPIMFAYYSTPDKASSSHPVNLTFKHALAKLTLDVTVASSIGSVNSAADATIMMYGDGLTEGITFDLTKATAVGATSGVYEVISQTTTPTPANLDGTSTATAGATPTPADTKAYFFEAIPDAGGDVQHFTVTGYLVPAGCDKTSGGTLENVKIRFYIGTGSNLQAYTANLDETVGGTVSGKTNYLPQIEPGKEYKFKIELKQDEVNFTGTIEDWTLVDKSSTTIPAV